MAKTNFFFERKEFIPPEIHKSYYTYLGYFLEKDDEKKIDERHPISIYFGKDEIAVYYTRDDNQLLKIFSLYVAEGTINQQMLAKKVEDYALMPLWPLSDDLLKDELGRLRVDPVLLHMGFFASYYGFEFGEDRFSKINLPGSRSNIVHIKDDSTLEFIYGKRGENDKNACEDTWNIKQDGKIKRDRKIKAFRISFSKILLDFLFELDFANTFEDENFFQLQPHIQNNLVLDALTKKCRYLLELSKLRTFKQESRKPQLPKPFQDIEKEWINVCRIENYKPVFVSPNSLFDDPETEVKNLCFEARIGEGRKRRKKYLKTREDAQLKNEICTFFMQKYNIWSAFRVLMPAWAIIIVACLLLAIPLGDHCLDCVIEKSDGLAGIFSVGLPMAIFLFMLVYYRSRGINLFKLLLPRLFLGIMIGWSVFWSTEELWKKALTTSASMVLVFDVFLLIIIFMYIFTDIANRMYRKVDRRVFFKSVNLIGMSLLMSFVIGFYVIQFFAEPMIENSGFLENKRLYAELPKEINAGNANMRKSEGDHQPSFFPQKIDEFFSEKSRDNEWTWELDDRVEYIRGSDNSVSRIQNYKLISLFMEMGTLKNILYIWSILFSQFVVSILIGVVLQLLWEDRAITEPL